MNRGGGEERETEESRVRSSGTLLLQGGGLAARPRPLPSSSAHTHLHVPADQVGRLLLRLHSDVDGGEGPAGHLLHLPQQLLRRRGEEQRSGHRLAGGSDVMGVEEVMSQRNRTHRQINTTVTVSNRHFYWFLIVCKKSRRVLEEEPGGRSLRGGRRSNQWR